MGGETNGVLVPGPRKNRSVTVRQAEALAPPPAEGVGAFAEAALEAAFNGITSGDMSEMMKAIVGKAKAGDMKAARFVLEFLGTHKPPPPQVTVHLHKTKRTRESRQTHGREPAEPGADPGAGPPPPPRAPDPPHVAVLRRFAAKILHHDGPTPAAGLAGQLGVDREGLEHLMAHEWFAAAAGGWALTAAGRREVG